MSELAFNMNGEAFEVPAAAVGWRVRRMKLKGAPEVVYGRNGVPLVVPLDADIEDVRREVEGTPGRYRLDPVDENHRPLHDVPAGYVYVHADPRPTELASKPVLAPATTEGVVIEAMRMNAELARSVIDRFPMMMEAAAILLRAADGAGLPARPGMATDDAGEEDDAEPATSAGSALGTMMAQVLPMLVAGFAGGGGKRAPGKSVIPSLGEMFDWRKAAAAAKPADSGGADGQGVTADESAVAVAAGVEPMVPPLDPATMGHFLAVRALLTPEESTLAGRIARELSAAEMRGLLDELAKLSVPDAAARVRELLTGKKANGGAS